MVAAAVCALAVAVVVAGSLWSLVSVNAANRSRDSLVWMQENHQDFIQQRIAARESKSEAATKLLAAKRVVEPAWDSFDRSLGDARTWFSADQVYEMWERWGESGNAQYQNYKVVVAYVEKAQVDFDDSANEALAADVVVRASSGALDTQRDELKVAENEARGRVIASGAAAVFAVSAAAAVVMFRRRKLQVGDNGSSARKAEDSP